MTNISLLLVGLALFLGVTLEFVPSMNWQGGPVANAMVWHDRQRIEQIILLAVTSAGALVLWRVKLLQSLNQLPRASLVLLLAGFSLGACSAGMSMYSRLAWLEWSTLLLLLTLAFLLAHEAVRAQSRFDVWAVRLLVLLATVIALRVLMGYLAAMLEGIRLDSVKLFTSVVSNRRVFGQVATMLIPLLAYPILRPDWTKGERAGLMALLAVWWMLAIASGTRGTWMALGLSSVLLATVAWRQAWPWLRIQLIALSLGLLLYGLMFVWFPAMFYPGAMVENRLGNLVGLSGREAIWLASLVQIQAHPWLGIGPMHLAAILGHNASHPHNVVLQLAAEWGVPAALALLIAMVWGLIALLRRIRLNASPLLLSLTAALLGASAQAMVDGVLVMPYTQIWLVFVMGWAMGVYFRDASVKDAGRWMLGRISMILVSVMMALALSLLMYGVFPEILHRAEYTKAYLDAGHNAIPPRYWMVGPIP